MSQRWETWPKKRHSLAIWESLTSSRVESGEPRPWKAPAGSELGLMTACTAFRQVQSPPRRKIFPQISAIRQLPAWMGPPIFARKAKNESPMALLSCLGWELQTPSPKMLLTLESQVWDSIKALSLSWPWTFVMMSPVLYILRAGFSSVSQIF